VLVNLIHIQLQLTLVLRVYRNFDRLSMFWLSLYFWYYPYGLADNIRIRELLIVIGTERT